MDAIFMFLLHVLMWLGLGLGLILVSALWGLINLIVVMEAWTMIQEFFGDDPDDEYGETQ